MVKNTIHGYDPVTNKAIPVVVDAGGNLLVVGTSGVSTNIYATVQGASPGGTGYSAGDVLVLRQIGTNNPEWFNTTTNAVLATAPTNVEPIGGVAGATRATNFPETVDTDEGEASISTPRVVLANQSKLPSATPYQTNGTGPILFGILSADGTSLTNIPSGATVAIGTGASDAVLVANAASNIETSTRTTDYNAIQDNAAGGVVDGRAYQRIQVFNVATETLIYEQWWDQELGTQLTPVQVAALDIPNDFDAGTVSSDGTPIVVLARTTLDLPVDGDAATTTRPAAGDLLTSTTSYTVNASTTFAEITLELHQSRINLLNDGTQTALILAENEFLGKYTTDGTTPSPNAAAEVGSWLPNQVTLVLSRADLDAFRIVGNQPDPTIAPVFTRSRIQVVEYSGSYPGPARYGSPPNLDWMLSGDTSSGGDTGTAQTGTLASFTTNLDTNTQIAAANANRQYSIIRNATDGLVYINYSNAATTADTGHVYSIPVGQFVQEDFNGQLNAIASAGATGTIAVTEVTV